MGNCNSNSDCTNDANTRALTTPATLSTISTNRSKKFFKFLNPLMLHGGYQYSLGYNKDILQFNPSGSCKPGGLYFTDKHNINEFAIYGDKLAVIILYKDSQVYPENNKAKADHFWIDDVIDPRDIDVVDVQNPTLEDIKKCPSNISNHKNPSYEMCKEAVSHNGLTIRFIPHNLKTQEIMELAVNQNPGAIEYCV